MAKVSHYYTKFQSDCFFHVYNRSINRDLMFRNPGNYIYFLDRLYYYLLPVIELYAYALLNDHFHILLKVKKLDQLRAELSLSEHDMVSLQFKKFFQSYALSFNNQYNRVGGLFQTPYKRVLVDNEVYFSYLTYYIHHNPENHQLVDDFRDWRWSSYHEIISDSTTCLQRTKILEWFGGKEEFIRYHSQKLDLELKSELLLE